MTGAGDATAVGFGGATVVGAGRGVSEDTAREVIAAAHAAGIRFFDTASMYAGGRSEELLGEVLSPVRDDVMICTKGGVHYPDLGDLRHFERDSSLDGLRRGLDASLRRLRTSAVDAFLIHQFDPTIPAEEAMENLARLRDEGLTRAVGFSNYGPADAAAALATGIPDYVEYSFSLLDRRYVGELDAAAAGGCRRLTYGTFVHGLLAEPLTAATTFAPHDWRGRARTEGPTGNSGGIFFAGDAYLRNLAVASRLRAIADRLGVSLAALTLAITRREGYSDITLIGCRSVAELEDNLSGLTLAIDDDVLAEVNTVLGGVERPATNELGRSTRR